MYDLIIIGAGPAGIAAGIALIRLRPELKDRVLVLEKEHFPRPKLCGGGLTQDAEAILKKLALNINEIPNVTSDAIRLQFKSTTFEYKIPGHSLRLVDRQEFDAWLYQNAINSGVMIKTGINVLSLRQGEHEVMLGTSQGEYISKFALIANGSKSTFLPANTKRVKAKVIELIIPRTNELFEKPLFDLTGKSYGFNGYFWAFPSCDASGLTLNLGVYDANIKPRPKKLRAIEALNEWAGRRGISIDVSSIKGAPINLMAGKPIVQTGRTYFIGDAVGVDPLLGEGISFSLGYGVVAAQFFSSQIDHPGIPDFQTFFQKSCLYKALKWRNFYAQLFYFFYQDWTTAILWQFFYKAINYLMRNVHSGWGEELDLEISG